MIPRKYEGRSIVVAATGPSLTPDVVETLREFRDKFVVIGVNDSYKAIDFLNEHYACDTKWWSIWGKDFREKFPELSSWSQCKESSTIYSLNYIKGAHKEGFSTSQDLIHYGKNSGYQALNLAYLMGGSKFILVGYNMKNLGQTHFFGQHPPGLNRNSPYPLFIQNYKTIQPEIAKNIINCTTNTALTMFKCADLRETLKNDLL